MEIDDLDRAGRVPRPSGNGLFGLTYVVFGLVFFALTAVAFFGATPDMVKGMLVSAGVMKREDFSALYSRLNVSPLPSETEAASAISVSLEKLQREPCDAHAIFALSRDMAKRQEERWAANALVGWAGGCAPDNAGELHQAASLFVSLHDYTRAQALAAGLVAAHPGVSAYWYIKGKADVGLHQIDDALLSYANTIHLTARPEDVGRWVFNEMSDIYVAAGHFCEAIGPLQDYMALDPDHRMTVPMQRIIETYAEQGHCAAFASGAETFPVGDTNVIHARVAVNGVMGTFVVDTGASFVAVSKAFAARAHLDGSAPASLRASSANGTVYLKLVSAETVKVGRVEAKAVPVAIDEGSLGALDGLLGRSFLSRFDLTIASDHWSLKPKAVASAH